MQQIFELNNLIYKENYIKQAISDFEEIAKINFDGKKLTIIGKNKEEIEEVFNELMNYIIGLINE